MTSIRTTEVLTKWDIIRELSRRSNRYGNLILELLDRAGVNNTESLTFEQAYEFFMEVIENEQQR